jgi:hypothetical protein
MGRKSIRQNTNPWPSDEFLEIKDPAFQPYVFVLTEDEKPSSIAMAAVAAGGMKYINLPFGTTVENLATVQEIVHDHAKKVGVPLFGKITGYLFVYSESEGVLLNLDGTEVGRKQGRFWPMSISIQSRI